MAAGPAGIIIIIIINLLFLVDFIPSTSGGAGATAGGGVLLYEEEQYHELAAPPPPPDDIIKVTFNVDPDEGDWDANYASLVDELRTRLRSEDSEWEGRLGVPVLPPQSPEGQVPTRWLDLVLERRNVTDDDASVTISVTVRIRVDNIYVVGFQRSRDDGQWWEFNRDHQDKKKPPPPPLIRGSKPLGYSCNYNHLAQKTAAGQSTTGVSLGRYPLSEAVKHLATVPRPDEERQPTARSMLIVIIMVSEATRFPQIANHFIDNWSYDIHLNQVMNVLIRSWGDISERLFHGFLNPDGNSFPLVLAQGLVIHTFSEAARILGIVLLPRTCFPKPPPRILVLLLLMPAAASSVQEGGGSRGESHCAEGRPLLEVISVIINDIDGEDPGQLYGTVNVTDALGSQSIYDRADRYNYENVSPGKAATLTGPADRAISAVAAVTIDLDLWDRDFTVLNPDDQVSKGAVEWDHFAFAERYDVPLSHTVKGMYGSATVNYVVFGDAVEAKFEVTLVKGRYEEKQGYVLYGRIVAQIGDDRRNIIGERVLLSTTSSRYSEVSSYEDRIPLDRTVLAVPLTSSHIRVSALLNDYSGYEIAGGCTYFGVRSSGTTRWSITGRYGEIEIKTIWNPSY